LLVRTYTAADAPTYLAAAGRNREHLARYESGNLLMNIHTLQDAEKVLAEMADWQAQGECCFLGVFEKPAMDFAAQVYIGAIFSDPPEYEVGYIADCEHEGRGMVREALQAVCLELFESGNARRLTLHCDEGNLRSRKVAESCSFTLASRAPKPEGKPGWDLEYERLNTNVQIVRSLEIK